MKRILVTGAAGFIGQHVIQFYSQQPGTAIVGTDIIDCPQMLKNIDGLTWECGDLINQTKDMFDSMGTKFDVVYHCAGSASVGFSIQYPTIDFDRNTRLLQNVLWELNQRKFNGVFMFISSAGVYGNQSESQLEETMTPNPISPYALNKRLCEDICQYFIQVKQMDIRIARVFSAYGNGLNKQLLWDMVQKWKLHGEISLFGSGEEGRDFIHVKDIVQALDLIVSNGQADIYNVGNGCAVHIKKIADLFKDYLKLKEEQIYFTGTAKEGDPDVLMSDNARLKALGYQQTISLEEGIKDYIQWATTIKQ